MAPTRKRHCAALHHGRQAGQLAILKAWQNPKTLRKRRHQLTYNSTLCAANSPCALRAFRKQASSSLILSEPLGAGDAIVVTGSGSRSPLVWLTSTTFAPIMRFRYVAAITLFSSS